jgi:ABC-2 type transport system permease protein
MTLKGLAEKYAKSMKIDLSDVQTPAEMHRLIDLRPEQNRYVMQLKYKGRTTFLRLFDDQIVFPSETETAQRSNGSCRPKCPRSPLYRESWNAASISG